MLPKFVGLVKRKGQVPRQNFNLYVRLLSQAQPYWKVALVSLAAVLVSAGLEPLFPALMQPLIDRSLILKDPQSLWQVPTLIFVVFALKGIADYAFSVSSQFLGQKVAADLRSAIFSAQLDLPISDHRSEDGGRMLTRITNEASTAGEIVATSWLTILRDSLVLIGLVGFLFYTAWQLALLVLILLPILSLIVHKINHKIRGSSQRAQVFMGRLSGMVEESLKNVSDIKIFGAIISQSERFSRISKSLRHENMRVARIQGLNLPLVQVTAALCVSIVVYAASYLSRVDALSPGQFVAFITAMSMVFEPIRRLANVNASIQRGLAAAESLYGILDRPGETLGAERGDVRRKVRGDTPDSITLRQLYYKYPGRDICALKNINLSIESGEAVCIQGPSGSGKSTLVHLLCGFDRNYEGGIYIGGRDVKVISVQHQRELISLVGQNVNLFDLTVRENICLGNRNADDSAVYSALKNSNSLEFVSNLPEGLETRLGFHGATLSGGQRQRLAIARAFLKDAPILIFDEPTSALDTESESEVFDAINRLCRDKTSIFISHSDLQSIDFAKKYEIRAGELFFKA
jgi:subfamily B ATP-binding cassette protein MsbA